MLGHETPTLKLSCWQRSGRREGDFETFAKEVTAITPRLGAALAVLLLLTACGGPSQAFNTPPKVVSAVRPSPASSTVPSTVPPSSSSSTPGPSATSPSLSMSTVRVAALDAPEDTGAIGFLVTIDAQAASAAVGPGWALQAGQLVPLYAGGSVALPTMVASGGALGGSPWPILVAVANTDSWTTATAVTVAVTIPENCGPGPSFAYPLTACPTGADGTGPPVNLTNAVARLAVLGETFQFYLNGSLVQASYPAPTWLLYQNTAPHVTWSGGGFGQGTPAYMP